MIYIEETLNNNQKMYVLEVDGCTYYLRVRERIVDNAVDPNWYEVWIRNENNVVLLAGNELAIHLDSVPEIKSLIGLLGASYPVMH